RQALAEANLFFDGIKVYALADAAIADGFNVFLGILGIDAIRGGNGSLLAGLGLFGFVRRRGSGLLRGRVSNGGQRRRRRRLSRRILRLGVGGSRYEKCGEECA